jgi:hypothetical protein
MQSNKTTSWVLRHPARVMAPPYGNRQVAIVEKHQDFDKAVFRAQQFNKVQLETFSRDRLAHYGNRDVFTILELDEQLNESEVLESFFENTNIRKEVIS